MPNLIYHELVAGTPASTDLFTFEDLGVNEVKKVTLTDLIALFPSGYTDEMAQDAVGLILTDSNTIDFTYNDPTPSITADVRTQMSITSDLNGIKFVNDVLTPGNSMYYGTDAGGTKGYFTLPAGSTDTNFAKDDLTATGDRTHTFAANTCQITFNSLAGNSGLKISSTSTAATGSTQKLLEVVLSGVNSNVGESTYAIYGSNTHSGTVPTNIGVYGTANGGTNNKGIYGVGGSSSSSFGVYGESQSSTGVGVYGSCNGGSSGRGIVGASADGGSIPISAQIITTSANDVYIAFELTRQTTGTATSGLGLSIEYDLEVSTGAMQKSNSIISKWTDATNPTRTSQLIITGVNSAVSGDILTLNGNKSVQFNGYGSGSFTGTPVYNLQVDASGNIIETGVLSGGDTNFAITDLTATGNRVHTFADKTVNITFNSLAGASGFKLSSTTTAADTNTQRLVEISLSGANVNSGQSTYSLYVNNYHSGTSNSNYAIWAATTNEAGGAAIVSTAANAVGFNCQSANSVSALFSLYPSSTNTVIPNTQFRRFTTGTAANGIGQSLDFIVQTSTGNQTEIINRLISKLTDATNATRTSQFIITGVNSAVTADLFTLSGSGALKLNKYGSGTFTGTPTYNLQVDASGNIIETGVLSGGDTNFAITDLTATGNRVHTFADKTVNITFNSLAGASGFKLSSTSTDAASNAQFLVEIALSGANSNSNQTTRALSVTNTHTGTGATNYGIYATVSNEGFGSAIRGDATTSNGVYGKSTSGVGVNGESSSNVGVYGTSTTSAGGQFLSNPSSTNTVVSVLKVIRTTTGTAANNIGGRIEFEVQTDAAFNRISNNIASFWVNASDVARISQMVITGVFNAVEKDVLTMIGSGALRANQYGSGSFTGTPAYTIQVDASGNLIEGTPGAGSVLGKFYSAVSSTNNSGSNPEDLLALTIPANTLTNDGDSIFVQAGSNFLTGSGTKEIRIRWDDGTNSRSLNRNPQTAIEDQRWNFRIVRLNSTTIISDGDITHVTTVSDALQVATTTWDFTQPLTIKIQAIQGAANDIIARYLFATVLKT